VKAGIFDRFGFFSGDIIASQPKSDDGYMLVVPPGQVLFEIGEGEKLL
jgi:hypothetical protein